MAGQGRMKRLLAWSLCLSVVAGCASCKKKDTEGRRREVKETDPFFEYECHELKIPVDDSKEVSRISVYSEKILGDHILLEYEVDYELPEGFGVHGYIPEGYSYEDYFSHSTAIFDLEGNLVRSADALQEDAFLQCMASDKDGNIAYLFTSYGETCSDRIVIRNDAGDTVREISLASQWEPRDTYFSDLTILPDGKNVICVSGSQARYVFSSEGEFLFKIDPMDRYISGTIFETDGKYYVVTMPSDFNSEMKGMLHEVDMTTGNLGEGRELRQELMFGLNMVSAEDGLYVSNPYGILKYSPESGEMSEILNWNQTDIDYTLLASVKSYPRNKDEIYALACTSDMRLSDTAYVLHLRRMEKNPHAGQTILYAGGMAMPDCFYEFIHDYNADPSHNIRIEAEDYLFSMDDTLESGESTGNNLEASTRLKLMSNEAPDILVNFAGFSGISNEDLFVDLNSFIDGRNGLDRSELFDSVLRAEEMNGKLYHAPVTFALSGIMVNQNLMDVERNWNLDDLEEAVSSLPSGIELVAVPEYMYLLNCFMEKDLSQYIDYDKKDVQFNTDSMKRAMDAARKYGRPNPEIKERSIGRAIYSEPGFTEVFGLYLGGDDMEGTDLGSLLYEGKIAMEEVKIPSLIEYNFYRGLMEKSGKLVGYPTSDGNGIAEDPILSLAIVSSTEYKEQAWEIIRSFYSDEAQRIMTKGQAIDHGGFPMRKSTFDTKCEEEITKINLAYDAYLKALQQGQDAGGHVYFQAPEDLGEELKGIIDGVKTACKTDSVTDIIQEEMAGYFQDSRSADEVLDTISNRVRQVIQER